MQRKHGGKREERIFDLVSTWKQAVRLLITPLYSPSEQSCAVQRGALYTSSPRKAIYRRRFPLVAPELFSFFLFWATFFRLPVFFCRCKKTKTKNSSRPKWRCRLTFSRACTVYEKLLLGKTSYSSKCRRHILKVQKLNLYTEKYWDDKMCMQVFLSFVWMYTCFGYIGRLFILHVERHYVLVYFAPARTRAPPGTSWPNH